MSDIRVVALVRGGSTETAEPLPEAVRDAAVIVGRDLDLRPDWLNAGPTSLIERAGLPRGFRKRLTTVEYGDALTVSFAGRLDQVHLKLYAAVDRGLARDFSDLRGLAPTTDELQQAATWVREHVAPGPYDERIADVLHQFGVEDVGRLD